MAFLVGEASGETWDAEEIARFVAGGATGFVLHESAHALAAESLGIDVRLEFQSRPVPFPVVRYNLIQTEDALGNTQYVDRKRTHIANGAQKQLAIASAGINSQNITSEWILTLHPRLREEQRPFLKGMLAFDILTSIAYALGGRRNRGGDVYQMSEALGVHNKFVAGLILAPAAIDLYRYYYPESSWTPWISRGAKSYLLGLSLRW